MKATSEIQRIDDLLLSLQETAAGSIEYSQIAHTLSTLIADPRLHLRDELLQIPPHIQDESLVISDALESVTNGMYNPSVLKKMGAIPEYSPFAAWKQTILAILAFYRGDHDNMLQLLKKIPTDTPPAVLLPIFLHLSHLEPMDEAPKEASSLIRMIKEDRTFLHSTVEQLEEYLDGDIEEAFGETTFLLIRDLIGSYPEAARRYALWSMQTAIRREYDLTIYLSEFNSLFGRLEGLHMTALALHKIEPDIAILFWLRYVVARISEELSDMIEIYAFLSIIADAVRTLIEDDLFEALQEDKEYTQNLATLIMKLRNESRRHFPDLSELPPELFPGISEEDGHFEPPEESYRWLLHAVAFDEQIFPSRSESSSEEELDKDSAQIQRAGSTQKLLDNSPNKNPKQLELF